MVDFCDISIIFESLNINNAMKESHEFKGKRTSASLATYRCCMFSSDFSFIFNTFTNGKSTRNHGTAGNDSAANRIAAHYHGPPATNSSG